MPEARITAGESAVTQILSNTPLTNTHFVDTIDATTKEGGWLNTASNQRAQTKTQPLRDLYVRFHNWELVFAAYHAGRGYVIRALHCRPCANQSKTFSCMRVVPS